MDTRSKHHQPLAFDPREHPDLSNWSEDDRLQIGILDIGQANTLGGLWIGQAAQVTGTDATNDVVADFTGTTEILFPHPSLAIPVIAVHEITLGSTFKIAMEGVWILQAKVHAQTAASVRVAISMDAAAGELSIDPVPTTRIFDVGLSISAGADTVPITVNSGPIVVTRDIAMDPTVGLVRLLMSNNAGAGAADAAVLVELTQLSIKRVGNIPRAVASG